MKQTCKVYKVNTFKELDKYFESESEERKAEEFIANNQDIQDSEDFWRDNEQDEPQESPENPEMIETE